MCVNLHTMFGMIFCPFFRVFIYWFDITKAKIQRNASIRPSTLILWYIATTKNFVLNLTRDLCSCFDMVVLTAVLLRLREKHSFINYIQSSKNSKPNASHTKFTITVSQYGQFASFFLYGHFCAFVLIFFILWCVCVCVFLKFRELARSEYFKLKNMCVCINSNYWNSPICFLPSFRFVSFHFFSSLLVVVFLYFKMRY